VWSIADVDDVSRSATVMSAQPPRVNLWACAGSTVIIRHVVAAVVTQNV
jgi:hypothetical protein